MTELAWLFSFALNTKKSYQIRQKLQVFWFCFMAFLKNVWLFWSKIVRIVMFLFWFEEFYEWLKAKQKLFGEPDRKKWICTFHGAHRASFLRNRRPTRWAISINHAGCDREKVFLNFLDLARAQRGLFRLFSQQGAQNGPRSPCYAYCRSRGGCRPSATAEVWLRRASVRPPD